MESVAASLLPMRRGLCRILCFGPLIICGALWLFTYIVPLRARVVELFGYPNGALVGETLVGVELEEGRIALRAGSMNPPPPARLARREWFAGILMPETSWPEPRGWPGIAWQARPYFFQSGARIVPGGTIWSLVIPFPCLLVVLSIPPAVSLRRRCRRWTRYRRGLCVECGYDLRATPDGCPECGAIPAVRSIIVM